MGTMKRREAREADQRANLYLDGLTLERVQQAGIPMLNVACLRCSRHGRYRVRGLTDRYGAYVELNNLKKIIARDCPKQRSTSPFDQCGVYFPGPLPGQP